ncbi:BAG family molecular chaperone regulator 1 isoform X2 [Pseudophryne corroboree]|uniref:BAG family molecular chaperone regulator 1 isoform X2 n=1 Tax=Pseudophryne corroboree TaxID=495146 RepID=UPI003081FE98
MRQQSVTPHLRRKRREVRFLSVCSASRTWNPVAFVLSLSHMGWLIKSHGQRCLWCAYKRSQKHKLQVVAQDENDEPTLLDMALAVEKITDVPITSQKLIYKGKSLKEMEKTLSALDIKNGCKVMLIGKKNCPEEESVLKKLNNLEKSVEQTASKLEDVTKELLGIQKGFLSKNLQEQALGRLDKRIKATVEQFMKILEQIDSVTMPVNFSDCRLKKKELVKNVQGLLAQCDTVEGNISQEIVKLQSQNVALSK